MRLFLVFIFIYSVAFSEDNINNKIKSTSKQIGSFSKNYTQLNAKMATTAKAILKQKLTIQKQQKYLKSLKEQLSNKELSYEKNKVQLKNLIALNKNLKKEQNTIEEELVICLCSNKFFSFVINIFNRLFQKCCLLTQRRYLV